MLTNANLGVLSFGVVPVVGSPVLLSLLLAITTFKVPGARLSPPANIPWTLNTFGALFRTHLFDVRPSQNPLLRRIQHPPLRRSDVSDPMGVGYEPPSFWGID